MKHIKDAIGDFLEKTRIDRPSPGDIIFEKWEEIAGEKAAKTTKPYKISGRKLFIYAENSVIMNEMVYYKKELLSRINSFIGKKEINELIFRIKQ